MVAVTVGLPFHNARGCLGEAIRSVFAQTFDDWELLLVDDGSTDGSLEVARSVRDPRVRVVSDGENRRLPHRLNQIVDLAQGDLVARLDADDLMHPERLEAELRILRHLASVDIVGTAFFAVDRDGRVVGIGGSGPVRADARHVLRNGLLAHATLLARRHWLREHRYDERYPRAEDRELYCRTLGDIRFAHVDEPLYFVRHLKEPVPTLRDYIASCRDNRRIFRRYAPGLLGPGGAAALVAESLGKELIFRAFTLAGRQETLVRRRGRRATEAELQNAEAALSRIRAAHVPGLDAPYVGSSTKPR